MNMLPQQLTPKKTGLLNLLVACPLALIPAGIGLYLALVLGSWQHDYTVKMNRVEAGEVKSELLTVLKKSTSGRRNHPTYGVTLQASNQPPFWRSIPGVRYDQVQVGDRAVAYRFADGYFIPQFFTGGWEIGQWQFLLIGLTVSGMLLVRQYFRWRQLKVS